MYKGNWWVDVLLSFLDKEVEAMRFPVLPIFTSEVEIPTSKILFLKPFSNEILAETY